MKMEKVNKILKKENTASYYERLEGNSVLMDGLSRSRADSEFFDSSTSVFLKFIFMVYYDYFFIILL
mgnify:CR=1 FL=1